MDKTPEQALEFHKKYKGKLEVKSKNRIDSKVLLSLAYTPGVAAVSSAIANDKNLARVYTLKANTVAVVSDGSAVLGLGNIGALAAIPVMEGKAVLLKDLAGVDAFPICLDTQDTEEIIKTIKNIAPVFGGINLEDISAPRCFEIERRLKQELSIPVMHDDQHATAAVVLAGLINALKVKGVRKEDVKVVVSGAGAAGTAVVKMLVMYGFKNIIICDSKGAIARGRKDLNEEKNELAQITNSENISGTLEESLSGADIFVGVSKGNIVTTKMVRSMNPEPIIFALANPIPEIMPDVARLAGALVVATGRSDFPNQVNNVLVFPGVFKGALDHGVRDITDTMLMNAAVALANHVKDISTERILPDVFDLGVVSVIANEIR